MERIYTVKFIFYLPLILLKLQPASFQGYISTVPFTQYQGPVKRTLGNVIDPPWPITSVRLGPLLRAWATFLLSREVTKTWKMPKGVWGDERSRREAQLRKRPAEHRQILPSQKEYIIFRKCKALGIQRLHKALAISRLAGGPDLLLVCISTICLWEHSLKVSICQLGHLCLSLNSTWWILCLQFPCCYL